jgi:hypothetical protein
MKRMARVAGGFTVVLAAWLGGGLASGEAKAQETAPAAPAEGSDGSPAPGTWSPSRPRARLARRWTNPSQRAQAQRAASPLAASSQPVMRRSAGRSISTDIHLEEGETLVSVGNQPVDGRSTSALVGPVEGMQPFAEEVPPGPVIEGFDGELAPYSAGAEFHGGPDGDCFPCEEESCSTCDEECCGLFHMHGTKICLCVDWCWLEELGLTGGVHGFKGPLDEGQNGNFGFHEGLNWGLPICRSCGIGFQAGALATQSNFTDGVNEGEDEGSEREQTFVTLGFFHRALCGLQGGVVVDWLDDDYYVGVQLAQLRGEVSFIGPCGNEFGCKIAAGTNEDDGIVDDELAEFSVRDFYSAFYRRHFQMGADARFWGGVTDDGAAVVGGDFHIPLSKCWALEAGATYLIPEDGQSEEAAEDETWGLAINVVWSPFRKLGCCPHDRCWGDKHQFRPLFGVADNSTFLVDVEDD